MLIKVGYVTIERSLRMIDQRNLLSIKMNLTSVEINFSHSEVIFDWLLLLLLCMMTIDNFETMLLDI